MLKQINILLDPLSPGGGGSTTIVNNPTTGQALSGTLSEGDDNIEPDDDSDSSDSSSDKAENIFDINQFKNDEKQPSDSTPKVKPLSKDKKPTTVKEDEEEVVEDDSDEETTVDVEGDGDNKQAQQDEKQSTIKRDYTGFNKEDVEYLKKLPNGVYNQVVPILKRLYAEQESNKSIREEHKKFKEDPNRIPDTWYEHPNAYTLSPEFKKLSDNYSKADFEANHWEQQLVNLKTHKAYIPIQGYDTKTGEYTFGEQVAVDDSQVARLEIQMQQLINKAHILKQDFNNQAVKLQTEFGSKHAAINSHYDRVDEMVKILPEQYHPKKEHIEKFNAAIHPSHRGTALANAFAKVYSIMINQGVALAEYAKKGETNLKNNLDNKAAGPKSSKNGKLSTSKNKSGDDNEPIDLDKLKQEMEN